MSISFCCPYQAGDQRSQEVLSYIQPSVRLGSSSAAIAPLPAQKMHAGQLRKQEQFSISQLYFTTSGCPFPSSMLEVGASRSQHQELGWSIAVIHSPVSPSELPHCVLGGSGDQQQSTLLIPHYHFTNLATSATHHDLVSQPGA